MIKNMFADKKNYEKETLKCRKCNNKEFEWEASNLWCKKCRTMQRV